MRNLIIGYNRGKNKWQCLTRALKSINQEVDVVTEDFDKIVGPYDRIFTVAESLLPIQAELEQLYGLTNLTPEAAEILSDKKKMDDFCIDIGLKEFIPDSVIPTLPEDLDIFKDRPFIMKPTIGSGIKHQGNIDYVSFNNKKDFLLSIDSSFFTKNKKGFRDEKFNNRLNRYMAQEQLGLEAEIWGPYYYGTKCLFWSKSKIRFVKIDEYSYEVKPLEWMSVPTSEVPVVVQDKCTYFMNKMIEKLKIKNMFFSGPDFYKWGSDLKMIDANPRIGQGLQILDDIHNNKVISNILLGIPMTFKKHYLWSIATLKPGKIKSVKDLSHLKDYLVKTNWKIKPGMEIPEFQHLVMGGFRQAFIVEGTNESDMRKIYQTINNQLQECIEYF
jgi:hypothetical protein